MITAGLFLLFITAIAGVFLMLHLHLKLRGQYLELQSEVEHFRDLFTSTMEGIFRTDKDGHFTFINQAGAEILGFESPEVMIKAGVTGWDLYSGEDSVDQFLDSVKAQKKIITHTVRANKGGKKIYIEAALRPAVKNGELAGVDGIFRDVTERIHLEKVVQERKAELDRMNRKLTRELDQRKNAESTLQSERSQLLSIFDSIDESIYVADMETNRILFANLRLKSTLGRDPVGELCYRAFQNKDTVCEFCTNDIIRKNRNRAYHWEFHNMNLNRDFIISDRMILWPDGRMVRMEIAIDVTELKKAQKKLRKYSVNLEKLVQEKTDQMIVLERRKNDLERLAMVGQMAASIVHEVRNPLSSIKMGLTSLLNRSVLKEKDLRCILLASREVGHLERIFQDLLDFSKPEGFRFISQNLNSVLNFLLDQMADQWSNPGITVHRHFAIDLPKIKIDLNRMRQVIVNLVQNAIEAMNSSGNIYIETAATGKNSVSLIIRDDGRGISRKGFPKIFEPFFSTRENGTGLGLTIVKNIVETHNGSITVESKSGKGTSVCIDLPADALDKKKYQKTSRAMTV